MLLKKYTIGILTMLLMPISLSLFSYNVSANISVKRFRDDTGQVLNLHRSPKRIVSLAPNMTEILFAIGAGDQVVGVTDFCNYPIQVRNKSRVGGGQIQAEAVLALKPDLVVANADMQPGIIKQLRSLGVTVAAYHPRNWKMVLHTIEELGLITGRSGAALGIKRKMEAERIKVLDEMKGHKRPRVFVEVWNKPLMTAGPGTFLHELITMAGGDDVASKLKRPWAVISAEDVLNKDPEIIILTCKNKQEVLHRPGWERVKAVREGRVYEVSPDIFSRPGPRLAEALATLSELFIEQPVEITGQRRRRAD